MGVTACRRTTCCVYVVLQALRQDDSRRDRAEALQNLNLFEGTLASMAGCKVGRLWCVVLFRFDAGGQVDAINKERLVALRRSRCSLSCEIIARSDRDNKRSSRPEGRYNRLRSPLRTSMLTLIACPEHEHAERKFYHRLV